MVPALEHRLYLASVSFSMVIPLLVNKTVLSATREFTFRSKYSLYSLFILAAFMLVYSAKTVTRNTIWQDEQTFWIHTLQDSPSSAFAHNNLGVVYARQGNHNEAIKVFKKALSLPTSEEFSNSASSTGIRLKIYNNLGESYRVLFEKQLEQKVKRKEKAPPRGSTVPDKPEGT
jgi:tetratricopeptide (TPR) repeat protein